MAELEKYNCRYTHATSIAPTGTISSGIGNNCSNGIEPTFAHESIRNRIVEGRSTKEAITMYSYEWLALQQIKPGSTLETSGFKDISTLTPENHVDIQAAAQKWVDSSISKTINCPGDLPFDKFKGVYMYAIDKGLKGCTTFRPNPEKMTNVLTTKEDQKRLKVRFTLEDGSTITANGSDVIRYEGQVHTAENLAAALLEGNYGKFWR
jgi:ribonucleoside-diphosphate reductase alpha chain